MACFHRTAVPCVSGERTGYVFDQEWGHLMRMGGGGGGGPHLDPAPLARPTTRPRFHVRPPIHDGGLHPRAPPPSVLRWNCRRGGGMDRIGLSSVCEW